MESLPHKERQRRLVEFQLVTTRREEFDFAGQEFFCDLQLVFVAQPVEHKLLIDARKNLWAQSLLCACENVSLQRSVRWNVGGSSIQPNRCLT